jgi:DNA-binding response OmpR family regulator
LTHSKSPAVYNACLVNRILIIDDDAELCALVSRFLSGEGFAVDRAADGSQGIGLALSGSYALVMLDVMMPDLGGFEVLRRIRACSRTPILMLTARGDTHDRVLGLELGADDYLPKPYDPSELSARIRAILRRSESLPGSGVSAPLTVDDIELTASTRTVTRDGESVDVTSVEFDLLEALMTVAGTVVRREDLVRGVLGRELSPYDRSIDTHVCNLRKKLGRLKDGRDRIKGIRGTGYLYAKSVS